MEFELLVSSDASTAETAVKVVEFLHPDERPTFEDEVAVEFQPLFLTLEPTPSFESGSVVNETHLHIHWSIGGGDEYSEIQRILKDFFDAKLNNIKAAMLIDGAITQVLTLSENGELQLINYDEDELEYSEEIESKFEFLDAIEN
jgi:hypothetical protein